MNLDFGAFVTVTHELRPCYVRGTTKHEVIAPASMGVWRPMTHVDGDFHFVASGTYDGLKPFDGPDGLPGLPMADPSKIPDRPGVYRLLRRFPSDFGGVVVGRTFRMEGQFHEGRGAGMYSDYEGDGDYVDESFLTESRRVPVCQVAACIQGETARPWPASVRVVHMDDVVIAGGKVQP